MVGIYAGNQQIKQISYGGTAINQVYYGSTLVWSALPSGTVMAESSTADETGSFTVEVPGTYRLTAVGGGGGVSVNNGGIAQSGGGGGTAIADFVLNAGDVISWKVGKLGGASGYGLNGGSGGQSYVNKGDATLVSANGGGGGFCNASSSGGKGGTASVDASGTNVTNQSGTNGTYKSSGATSASTAPAGGTSGYGTYGKGRSGYVISYNTPGWVAGTAGYIKIVYIG